MRRGRTTIHSVSHRKGPPLDSVRIYSVWKVKIDIDLRKSSMWDAVCKGKENKSKRMRCGNDVLQFCFPGLRGRNPPQAAASQPPYDWWTCTSHKRPNEKRLNLQSFHDLTKLVIFCNCLM